MGNAEPVAMRCYCFRLGGSFGAQAVIDGGDLEPRRDRLVSKPQQGEAVGAAGYREADPV